MNLFPSPIAFSLGPLTVYWYGIAYAIGGWAGWHLTHRAIKAHLLPWLPPDVWHRALPYIMAGVLIGGRLGFVFLYEPTFFWHDPLEVLRLWNRGMAFHGGVLGVIGAMWLLARRHQCSVWPVIDGVAFAAPLGILLGRVANFINQEHIGRPTHQPWGVLFPSFPDTWRHPAPLYEALLEGALLWVIMHHAGKRGWGRHPKALSGLFCVGYGWARWVCEYFREPDGMWGWFTTGQWYTLPCIVGGLWLLYQSRHSGQSRDPQGLGV